MKIELTTTRDIQASAIADALKILGSLGVLVEHHELLHKSANETPSFVSVMADLLSWKTFLAVPALAFISELGTKAADEAWDKRQVIWTALNNKAAHPIATMARSLTDLANSSEKDTKISIGLSTPNNSFGVTLKISSDSEEEIALALAIFAHKIEAIQKALTEDILTKYKPFGAINLKLLNNKTFIMTWYSDSDNESHELIIQ